MHLKLSQWKEVFLLVIPTSLIVPVQVLSETLHFQKKISKGSSETNFVKKEKKRIMDQATRRSHGHDQALASDTFDKFCNSGSLKDILTLYRQLCSVCKLVPTNFQDFFPKIRVRIHFTTHTHLLIHPFFDIPSNYFMVLWISLSIKNGC